VRSLGLDRLDVVNLRMGDRGHTDIVCVQNLYNIAAREDDPLVDACARDGIAYIPFFPVGGHRPLTAEHLSKVAARLGATAPQVALAWLLARSPNMVLIPGTGWLAHLEQNIAAGELRLTDDDLAQLDE
jgi:pyridoxine 4-dehydrogenase